MTNVDSETPMDDRSSLSSPNESDESSDVDSPLVDTPQIESASKVYGSNALPTAPSSVASGHAQLRNTTQFQQESAIGSSSLTNQLEIGNMTKPPAVTARPSGSANLNNVIYPTSSLSSIPQEVLLQLIQSGHLQLHTEEDGSGNQYITIPLPMSSSVLSTAPSFLAKGSNIVSTKVFGANESSSNAERTTTKDAPQFAMSPTSGDISIKQELLD